VLVSEMCSLLCNSFAVFCMSLLMVIRVRTDSGGRVEVNVGIKLAGIFPTRRSYRCCYCDYNSTSKGSIRFHVMRHLNYQPYSCKFCDFVAISGYYVNKHVRLRHPNVPDDQCNCVCSRNEEMDGLLKKGYYTVHVSEYAVKDMPVKLQDHTYTCHAVPSVAGTKKATSDSFQSHGRIRADNGTPKVPTFQWKKKKVVLVKKKPSAVLSNGYSYRCCQCTYVAASRRSVSQHISKMHGKLELGKNREDLFTCHQISSDVDVETPTAGISSMVNDCLQTSSDLDDRSPSVLERDVPPDEADTCENSDLLPCEMVNDVIYCCETCPCSFSTPEALSSHKCAATMQ